MTATKIVDASALAALLFGEPEAEFRCVEGNVTGQALIEALQASPYPDVELEPTRGPMPVSDT